MGELLKKAGKVVSAKIGWWLAGLIGLSGGAIIIGVVLFVAIITALITGVVSDQQSKENNLPGIYACSPNKKLDSTSWNKVFDSENTSGKLNGYGKKIIELSEEKGIDPVLFGAIALHETAWGKSKAIKNYNNPGGLMDPSTGSQSLYQYDTLGAGLEAMANTLYNRIIRDGLVTVEELGNVYAPIGADNDPSGLNSNWIPTTNEIAGKLGGLTMNCEIVDDFNIEYGGDVSELRKKIATVGNKWIGKTKYHWGGGRTPETAARGEFDCSSFVHWAYKQNGIELGNMGGVSTETLNKMGKKISISEIKVGDLIFWDSYKKDGHVAIYIGDGKFIGSQTSTGVDVVSLNNSYWSPIFSGHVRRIIED